MQIDLANWFEIATAFVVFICLMLKPAKNTTILIVILLITIGVEFTAKYLNRSFGSTNDLSYRTTKYAMYSLFNIVKFCGFTWFIFLLLKDYKMSKLYVLVSSLIFLFVVFNITMWQGYKIYNNFSNVFGIICLTGVVLYKLRNFEDTNFSQRQKIAVLVYLLTLFFYYAVNLPFYVFFQQMFAKDKSQAVLIYRIINDGANYIFYVGLSLATILYTFDNRNNIILQPTMA